MCRSLLQKLKDEQATAVRNQQYPASSCPICFEDLAKPNAARSSAPEGQLGSDGLAGRDGGPGSSKAEVEPSAPPLDGRPEYESLLAESRQMDKAEEVDHKHGR